MIIETWVYQLKDLMQKAVKVTSCTEVGAIAHHHPLIDYSGLPPPDVG